MENISDNEIESSENEYYKVFLEKAVGFARDPEKAKINGIYFKQLVAAAGVVAKQRQTRGAMKALEYQIRRDTALGRLDTTKQIEAKRKS